MSSTLEHKNIPDSELHQPKGIAGASVGAIIVANGSGGSATSNNANTPANLYDNDLRRPALKDYAEVINAIGNVTGSQAINAENGNVATLTLTGDTTVTFTNPSATGKGCGLTLIITQNGTGNHIITWPISVKWAGGSAPTLSTAAASEDILSFYTINNGTKWYGFVGGLAFA